MNDAKRLLYSAWLKSFQGLAWQFDYAQSSLVALNEWQHPLLGSNTERLIKDASYRSQFLSPADLALVNEFWDVLGNGASATIWFTVHLDKHSEKITKIQDLQDNEDGTEPEKCPIQFLLHGWADPESDAVLGYLQVAPPVYTGELAVSNVHTLLFRSSYPVFAMAYESDRVVALNAAARKLFGFAEDEDSANISARALFTPSSYKMVQKWAIKGLSTPWAGNLSFKDANGKTFLCHVRSSPQETLSRTALSQQFIKPTSQTAGPNAIQSAGANVGQTAGQTATQSAGANANQNAGSSTKASPDLKISEGISPSTIHSAHEAAESSAVRSPYETETLLRFAFLEHHAHKHTKRAEKQADALLDAVRETGSLREALTCILASIPEADGILFSDINARKGKVFVYGVGSNFDTMPWGIEYPYDGTVTQVIEHHKHSFLVVSNTKDSIRVIDWALFIPYGVHSYFAKGFTTRGQLRSLVVVTSNKTDAFARCNQTGVGSYQYIDAAFTKAVQRWRHDKQ